MPASSLRFGEVTLSKKLPSKSFIYHVRLYNVRAFNHDIDATPTRTLGITISPSNCLGNRDNTRVADNVALALPLSARTIMQISSILATMDRTEIIRLISIQIWRIQPNGGDYISMADINFKFLRPCVNSLNCLESYQVYCY